MLTAANFTAKTKHISCRFQRSWFSQHSQTRANSSTLEWLRVFTGQRENVFCSLHFFAFHTFVIITNTTAVWTAREWMSDSHNDEKLERELKRSLSLSQSLDIICSLLVFFHLQKRKIHHFCFKKWIKVNSFVITCDTSRSLSFSSLFSLFQTCWLCLALNKKLEEELCKEKI